MSPPLEVLFAVLANAPLLRGGRFFAQLVESADARDVDPGLLSNAGAVAVPEPAPLLLIAAGVLVIALVRRLKP